VARAAWDREWKAWAEEVHRRIDGASSTGDELKKNKPAYDVDHAVFHVRTLAEIDYLGAMIETVMEHRAEFEVSMHQEMQHLAALTVLHWVRCNPDCQDLTKQFEDILKMRGYTPPTPMRKM
jgi:hypothetical protein